MLASPLLPDSTTTPFLHAAVIQLGTNPSAAGSSYVERGFTKVAVTVCVINSLPLISSPNLLGKRGELLLLPLLLLSPTTNGGVFALAVACRYAPREAPKQAQQDFSSIGMLACDVRFAPFASKRRRERDSSLVEEERSAALELARSLRPFVILEKYPKATIEVFAMVLQSDGGVDAAVAVATALALADAGIEMYDIPCVMRVAGVASPGSAGGDGSASGADGARLTVDPDKELEASASFVTSVCMSRRGLITSSDHSGEATTDDLLRALALSMDAGMALVSDMREALIKRERERTRDSSSVQIHETGEGAAESMSMVDDGSAILGGVETAPD